MCSSDLIGATGTYMVGVTVADMAPPPTGPAADAVPSTTSAPTGPAAISVTARLTAPAGWQHGGALDVASADGATITYAPTSLEMLIDHPVVLGSHFRSVTLWPAGSAMGEHALDVVADTVGASLGAGALYAWGIIRGRDGL